MADWARVSRHEDGRVDIRQAHNTTGAGLTGGALWGALFGLIFLMPLAGMVIGGAIGALTGALSDYGINDRFIKDLGQQITPGHSALFLYVVKATPDKVIERLREYQPTLIRTTLSEDAEAKLRAAMEVKTPA
ncbi:MAG: DUF1269 domain-containing protein [Chloroflexi bacterium]|nr:DUF1269 domain-containing protein [Chloroflexota bacterium]